MNTLKTLFKHIATLNGTSADRVRVEFGSNTGMVVLEFGAGHPRKLPEFKIDEAVGYERSLAAALVESADARVQAREDEVAKLEERLVAARAELAKAQELRAEIDRIAKGPPPHVTTTVNISGALLTGSARSVAEDVAKVLQREAVPFRAPEAHDPETDALLEAGAHLFPSPEGGEFIARANARRTLLA